MEQALHHCSLFFFAYLLDTFEHFILQMSLRINLLNAIENLIEIVMWKNIECIY